MVNGFDTVTTEILTSTDITYYAQVSGCTCVGSTAHEAISTSSLSSSSVTASPRLIIFRSIHWTLSPPATLEDENNNNNNNKTSTRTNYGDDPLRRIKRASEMVNGHSYVLSLPFRDCDKRCSDYNKMKDSRRHYDNILQLPKVYNKFTVTCSGEGKNVMDANILGAAKFQCWPKANILEFSIG